MIKKTSTFIPVIALSIASTVQAQSRSETITVNQGILSGTTDGRVSSFKGIPFAAPPVKERRWKPPAPPRGWLGTRDATKFGPACIQPRLHGDDSEQSEDCLTLNIWKPAKVSPGVKLPIMFWIHGGAYTVGSGSMPIYDGTHFAEHGVILITANYRLGALGFFSHPALTSEDRNGYLANFGIMDNIAALKWVKENASSFGGDPENITIFGESAGGVSVNILMTAPVASGLFAKAISESSFGRIPLNPIRGDQPLTGEKIGLALAAKYGITGVGPDAATALRDLPPEKVAAIFNGGGKSDSLPSAMPVIDGKIVLESPYDAFVSGRENKVPLIIGGNSWEASLIPKVKAEPSEALDRFGALRPTILKIYPGSEVDKAQDSKTDVAMTEPNRSYAFLHSQHGQKSYTYYFSYVPEKLRKSLHGAPHGGEIPYVFGNLPKIETAFYDVTLPKATPQDRSISDAMISYWTNFARTGAPGTFAGKHWQSISPNNFFMEFGPSHAQPQPHFKQRQLDALEKAPDTVRLPSL